jgi:hypothetical protein
MPSRSKNVCAELNTLSQRFSKIIAADAAWTLLLAVRCDSVIIEPLQINMPLLPDRRASWNMWVNCGLWLAVF